jgi:hypothetical protein
LLIYVTTCSNCVIQEIGILSSKVCCWFFAQALKTESSQLERNMTKEDNKLHYKDRIMILVNHGCCALSFGLGIIWKVTQKCIHCWNSRSGSSIIWHSCTGLARSSLQTWNFKLSRSLPTKSGIKCVCNIGTLLPVSDVVPSLILYDRYTCSICWCMRIHRHSSEVAWLPRNNLLGTIKLKVNNIF